MTFNIHVQQLTVILLSYFRNIGLPRWHPWQGVAATRRACCRCRHEGHRGRYGPTDRLSQARRNGLEEPREVVEGLKYLTIL